jgi:hypothetical protein
MAGLQQWHERPTHKTASTSVEMGGGGQQDTQRGLQADPKAESFKTNGRVFHRAP